MKKLLPFVFTSIATAGLVVAGIAGWNIFKNVPVPPPAPAPIALDPTYPGHIGRMVVVQATTTGVLVKWTMLSGPTPDNFDLVVEDAHTVYFCTPIQGDFRLEAITVVGGEAQRAETHLLIDSGPVPPVPPIPPIPPVPPVPPNPPPIGADGLTMLIITDQSQALAKGQIDIINSTAIEQFVQKNGKQPKGSWRKYDVALTADQLTDEPQFWKDAFAAAKTSTSFKTPWLCISNGKTGFSGPLPTTVNEVLALLQKYLSAVAWRWILPELDREDVVAWVQ